jgi:predicted esterase
MSLFAGLTCPQKLGGIFGLSCYMLLQGKLKEKIGEAGSANNTTKIFMGHGDADQVVRYDWGKQTAEKLKGWGHEVDFKTYKYESRSTVAQYLFNILPGISRTVLIRRKLTTWSPS